MRTAHDSLERSQPAIDEETRLALASRSGDRDAFITLYDLYLRRIEGYIRYRVSDISEVEDLVSTTFERALTHIDRYDPARGSFGVWLFAIARNAVHNSHRASAHFASTELPETPSDDDPLSSALHEERVRQLRAAVAALSRDQQDALALRYGADLSFSQVGMSMNKSEPAAKMLVQRALAGLRKQIRVPASPGEKDQS